MLIRNIASCLSGLGFRVSSKSHVTPVVLQRFTTGHVDPCELTDPLFAIRRMIMGILVTGAFTRQGFAYSGVP